MAQNSGTVSWWIVLLPSVLVSLGMMLAMWIMVRKRRWGDWKRLDKATHLPPEHIPSEPREVRDMLPGEEAYVDRYAIVISEKKHQVFVPWTATLKAAPEDPSNPFAPLRIRRLERGFSLVVRAGDEFRTSPLPWGQDAPVIEIIQAAPKENQTS